MFYARISAVSLLPVLLLAWGCSGQSDGGPAGPEGAGGNAGAAGGGTPTDVALADPGRVTLRRLNRLEYNNTVRDLLGTALRPADEFPSDDLGHGFDNNGDVLSMSPLLVEMFDQAAEALIAELLGSPIGAGGPGQAGGSAIQVFEAEEVGSDVGAASGAFWSLYSNGSVATDVTTVESRYTIRARAYCGHAGPDDCRLTLEVDGLPVNGELEVPQDESAPGTFEVTTMLQAGVHSIGVSFTNDYFLDGADRNLFVDWIEVEGPLDVVDGGSGDSPTRDAVIDCDPGQLGERPCAQQVLEGFVPRAYRRPLAGDDLDRLLELFDDALDDTGSFDTAIGTALHAVLLSPHFLFKVELDPEPANLEAHPLTNHELATRLSYLLWASMPDAELSGVADAGTLGDEDTLVAQVRRMLSDGRSDAFVESFAGQWLVTRALAEVEPDYLAFPDFDGPLRAAMQRETEEFFRQFLFGDAPVTEMLTADYSFVESRLAVHYGIDFSGSGSQRVSLAGSGRSGLLGHGSILTLTSYPTRTSPVKRGKWVLEQLLCSPPNPPPPDVEGFREAEVPTGTLREQFEAHRADPSCAGCHASLDPLGFGLETFDGIGALRDEDVGGFAIDASGELPDGTLFDGPEELGAILASDPRFPRCLTQQLFTYALGRGPTDHDQIHIDGIAAAFTGGDKTLGSLLELLVVSDAFRSRRGQKEAP